MKLGIVIRGASFISPRIFINVSIESVVGRK
jgi:hypothetical protein